MSLGGAEKMSKSKNNVVDPEFIIDRYGADTARLFVMFASHPEATLEWSDAGVEGAYRFLRRLWTYATTRGRTAMEHVTGEFFSQALNGSGLSQDVRKFRHEIHSTLKQAAYDMERIQYNTVVSAAMKMLNALEDFAGGPGVHSGQRAGSGAARSARHHVAPALSGVPAHLSRAVD